VHRNRFIFK